MCGSTGSVFVSVWVHLTIVTSGRKKLKLFFCTFVTLTKNNLFFGYMLLNLLNHHIQLLLRFSVIRFDLQHKFKVFLCQLQIIDSYSCLLTRRQQWHPIRRNFHIIWHTNTWKYMFFNQHFYSREVFHIPHLNFTIT